MPKKKSVQKRVHHHSSPAASSKKFSFFNLKLFGLHITPMILVIGGAVLFVFQGVVGLLSLILLISGGIGLVASAFRGLRR